MYNIHNPFLLLFIGGEWDKINNWCFRKLKVITGFKVS